MVIDQNEINTEEFFEEFKKRFKNFCNRVPLFIHPYYTPNKVIIYSYKNLRDSEKTKLFEYEFDYSIDVKENIFEIKKILQENYYPIMKQVYEEEKIYSAEKLNHLVAENKISVDDITPKGGVLETREITWRIEKVLLDEDGILLRDVDEDKLYRSHIRMPVTSFLKTILTEIYDPFERWLLFERKMRDLKLFYEVDKNNKKLGRYKRGN
jgi:hypothetical protein